MKLIKRLFLAVIAAMLGCTVVLAACGQTPPTPEKPEVVLQNIKVTTMPARVDYYVDDTFSAEGGVLTATYSDNSTKEVPLTDGSVELSQPDTSVTGNKNVVVRYGGKQTTFRISVTKEQFEVTFKYNDGATADLTNTVDKGDKVEKPADPTRTNFEFEGWFSDEETTLAYDFNTPVTSAITLHGKWLDVSKKTYKATFNFNHSALKKPTVVQTVEEGSSAIRLATDPQRYGYSFDGWFTQATGGEPYDFTQALTANVTIYAHWTRTLLGVQDYVFEAENTSLKDKSGPATSGTAVGGAMVVQNLSGGVSGIGYVSYLYKMGNSLEFYITSDVEVSGVSIWVRMSAEMIPQTFSKENFMILLNDVPYDYGTVEFTKEQIPDNGGDLGKVYHADFRDVPIGSDLTLNKGVNTIRVMTANHTPNVGGSTW